MAALSPDNRADYVDRIDVNDPAELRRWAEILNVSEESLRRAIAATGMMIDDIREELENPSSYFLSATNTPSQSGLGGSIRKFSIRSR